MPVDKHLKKRKTPVQPSNSALVIHKENGKALSKEQTKFNKNVRQIENLQRKLAAHAKMLDKMMDYFRDKFVPIQQEGMLQRKDLIRVLFVYFTKKQKGITKKDKEVLGAILSDLIRYVVDHEGKLDPDLAKILRVVTDESYKKATKGDVETAKLEAIGLLESNGVEFEEDELLAIDNFADLEEAVEKLFREHFGSDIEQQDEEVSPEESILEDDEEFKTEIPNRKKTAKQLEREQKEKAAIDLKKRNIGYIYKQLAKLFHPDLEMDPSKKEEKEVLMKELTQAYQQNDLHTLLRLELKWVQKAESNAGDLADEKLKLYNSILREQIGELKDEIDTLCLHPQYQEMMEYIPELGDLSLKELSRSLDAVSSEVDEMKDSLKVLSKNNAASIQEIKFIVAERNRMQEIMNGLAFFEDEFDEDEFDEDDFDEDDDYFFG